MLTKINVYKCFSTFNQNKIYIFVKKKNYKNLEIYFLYYLLKIKKLFKTDVFIYFCSQYRIYILYIYKCNKNENMEENLTRIKENPSFC